MLTTWIILNFLLVLLAFYLIVHLYQRIRILEQSARQPTDELEEVLTAYLDEIRQENDRLAERVGAMVKKDDRLSTEASQRKTAASDKQNRAEKATQSRSPRTFNEELRKQMDTASAPGKVSDKADPDPADDAWMPPVDGVQDTFEASLAAQVMKLHEQGYTASEIARSLNRGEGEIRLLLKIRGKTQP